MGSTARSIFNGCWPSSADLSAAEEQADLATIAQWVVDLAGAPDLRERGLAISTAEWNLRRLVFPHIVRVAVDSVMTAVEYETGKNLFAVPDFSVLKGSPSPLSRGLLAGLLAYRNELAASTAKSVADALRDM